MLDAAAMERAHAILDPIAQEYLAMPDVDIGAMFGSEGLRVRGKVFAFVSFQGSLALKLPEARVDELDAAAGTARMVMRERSMREWLIVSPDAPDRWAPLVAEAYVFVDSITP
ncbi:TfoX/Sxy family protein [Microbacterium deminutum]